MAAAPVPVPPSGGRRLALHSWQVEPEPLSSVLTLYNQNTRVCLVILCASPTSTLPCHSVPLSHCLSVLSKLGPISPLPRLSLQHPSPWLASPHFPPGPSMAPPRLSLIAQTWLLSTPPAAAVPAQALLSPAPRLGSQTHHTAQHPDPVLRPITLQSLAYLLTGLQAVASLISSSQQLWVSSLAIPI